MPNTRLRVRKGDPETMSVDQGLTAVDFTSGIAEHAFLTGSGGADDLGNLLDQFPEIEELGRPGIATAVSADLSAESEITVPTGKYWRVIGGFLQYTASADAATRTPVITLEDDSGTAYATVTTATKVANDVENEHFLAGTQGNVADGTEGVAAQGTLTLDTNPTDGDTMTIDSITYTFVDAADGSTTREIEIGNDLAATKANVEAVLVDGDHPTVNAIAFSSDDMVLTARTVGTDGDAIATTETFTAGTNVFDGTTLGTTTAGVNPSDDLLDSDDVDFPDAGVLLGPGEVIALNVTNGHANDAAELAIFYIEFDNNPAP